MGHSIQAVIGKTSHLQLLVDRWPYATLVSLKQDISLIPLMETFVDNIPKPVSSKDFNTYTEKFEYADPALFCLLHQESMNGKIGFIETNYFGGDGTQSSILFDKKQIFGPYHDEDVGDPDNYPINRILNLLGVDKKTIVTNFKPLVWQTVGVMRV